LACAGIRASPRECATSSNAIRVYLADGNDYFRDGLRDLLKAHDGIEVVGAAGDVRHAEMEVSRLRPDVVVRDISLPHMDGAEAAALVRALAACARVILLSLHATTEHVLHAMQAGACGYLLKSCAAEEIVEAVHAVHGGRRYVSHKLAELLAEEYLRRSLARDRELH